MSLFDVNSESILEGLQKAYNWPWPQPHAELCPVCMGKGEVKYDPTSLAYNTCHGCGGKGWVTVA